MCIVVLYLGEEESEDPYQVLLAANRDEAFRRPTSNFQYFTNLDDDLRGCVPILNTTTTTNGDGDGIGSSPPMVVMENAAMSMVRQQQRRIALGRRDECLGDDGMPLAGSQFLVGSGRRWSILTNGTGPYKYQSQCTQSKDEEEKERDGTQEKDKNKDKNKNHDADAASSMSDEDAAAVKRQQGHQTTTTSRGQIIPSFINSNCTPEQFIASLQQCPSKGILFEGYNLILGIGNHAYHVTNRPTFAWERLETGRVYGVSNGVLDEESGKVVKLKSLFEPIVTDLRERTRERVLGDDLTQQQHHHHQSRYRYVYM